MRASLNAILDRLEDDRTLESEEALFEAFAQWAEESGRPLYPHQEEAILELMTGSHVIAQTPTGSGKSLIALGAHFLSLARGGRSYYTAPLKALVSEKFFDLVDAFGATNVGMITGDVSLNAQAPIICCTAEILANQALREGPGLDVDIVVMDEFHFYGDPQRGWAWQIPLLELPKAQFLALSATLGDTSELCQDLERRTGREVSVVSDAQRPVPLEFDYLIEELPVVVERLIKEDKAPVYIVHFSQKEAVATAKNLDKITMIDKPKKARITEALSGESFGRGFGQALRGLLVQGIGVHHAGMLPRYRRLVERLTQQGLLAVICGTDTLGVGINVPIRTVLFTSLVKFDGVRMRHLMAREFHQIGGRAGRAGFDDIGYVRGLGAESEVEQVKRQARLSAAQEEANKKKLKKLAKKAGPQAKTAGKVTWTKATFERLRDAEPEVLRSRFHTNHAFFLNVLAGPGDPEARLLTLATDNHEPAQESNPHLRALGGIYRSLRQAGILDRVPVAQAAAEGQPRLRAVRDLPDEFALNQPLAPFALAALDLLDMDSPEHALDVVSVVEAVMEDPTPLLWAQQRRARDQAFAVMKAEGIEYDERTEALQQITWPRPLSELLDPTFKIFALTNPWVGDRMPSPKSVVRDMIESAMTFSTLISYYDLDNAEGVILRYLSDTYRALRQIPPARFQTPELEEIIDWLGNLVRSVDSSLLDEWERLSNDDWQPAVAVATDEAVFGAGEDGQVTFARNLHALRKAVRKAVFRRVEMMSRDAIERLGELDGDSGWDADRWDQVLTRYWAEHDWIGIDHRAMSPELFVLQESPDVDDLLRATEIESADDLPLTEAGDLNWWIAEQTLLDPAGEGDWRLVGLVDLGKSQAENQVALRIVAVGVR